MDRNEDYFTKKALKERGWAEKLISKHLGKPDIVKKYRAIGGARTVYLYSRDRVVSVECSDLFVRDAEISKKRSQAASKGAETKTNNLIEQIENMDINIPDLHPSRVRKNSSP